MHSETLVSKVVKRDPVASPILSLARNNPGAVRPSPLTSEPCALLIRARLEGPVDAHAGFMQSIRVLIEPDSERAMVWLDRAWERNRAEGSIHGLNADLMFSCLAQLRRGGRRNAAMQSITSHQRSESCSAPVPVPTTRQRPRSHGPGRVQWSRSKPRRWVLVQLWDGSLLAAFDDEANARAAMSYVDDDEVVVLCVGA